MTTHSVYIVQGTWDGVWWELGRGLTIEQAKEAAKGDHGFKEEFHKIPLRVVKVTHTTTSEIIEGEP